jgi:hypothetical protein
MANVGVAAAAMVVVTPAAAVPRQAPVAGFVSQMDKATGRLAPPNPGVAVIVPVDPTFTDATAKAPDPPTPGRRTVPSPVGVTADATMSGTGVFDADSKSVFRPVVTGAGLVLEQSKVNSTSVGLNEAVVVKANTYVCSPPAGISTGVFGVPTSAFVAGSVVWYEKLAGMKVIGCKPQLSAVVSSMLMTVANAVAVSPTWTERLLGSTAAARLAVQSLQLVVSINA